AAARDRRSAKGASHGARPRPSAPRGAPRGTIRSRRPGSRWRRGPTGWRWSAGGRGPRRGRWKDPGSFPALHLQAHGAALGPAPVAVDPEDLVHPDAERVGQRRVARACPAAPEEDLVDPTDAGDPLDRRLERAPLQRLAEGPPVDVEEAGDALGGAAGA